MNLDLVPALAVGMTTVAILVVAALVGLVIAFALIWYLVVFLISRFGDWHRLATVYQSGEREMAGQHHGGVIGWVGKARYKRSLVLTVAPDGFFLEVHPVFRFGHPRLFIPWNALGERQARRVMSWEMLVCEVGHPRLGVIALPADLLQPPA